MSDNIPNSEENEEEWEGDLKSYIIGFVLSLLFTGTAFLSVIKNWVEGSGLIVTLALLQFVTQLIYFLHLGKTPKASWSMVVFWFMLLIVIIVVLGSLWIMLNLNERGMSWMK